VGGSLKKRPFFVMSLPYSDAFHVQVFESECTESFWEGHVRAFGFFGAVPVRISYDNSKVAVVQILRGGACKLTDAFLQLQSHYLFEEHFCLAARGKEKGVVEGMVRYSRANFLVPVPQVRSLDELNAQLEESCRENLKRPVARPGPDQGSVAGRRVGRDTGVADGCLRGLPGTGDPGEQSVAGYPHARNARTQALLRPGAKI